jgi:hypothetical protein
MCCLADIWLFLGLPRLSVLRMNSYGPNLHGRLEKGSRIYLIPLSWLRPREGFVPVEVGPVFQENSTTLNRAVT